MAFIYTLSQYEAEKFPMKGKRGNSEAENHCAVSLHRTRRYTGDVVELTAAQVE